MGAAVNDTYRYKIICDPVHGEIPLSQLEQQLVDTPSFQRLRNLKQLGLASLVYPNATHTRFAHSLGVFRIMSRVIDLLVGKGHFDEDDQRVIRIAALLHDIGHYPYSHLMEFIDGDKEYRPNLLVKESSLASQQTERVRYPKHEKMGELIISQRDDIKHVLKEADLDPDEIASIICGQHQNPAYNRLMHSSLDMDRMDYLVRDSLATGVPYGKIDLDYLLSNLDVVTEEIEGQESVDIILSKKAATAAEHFLIARYFMHKVVYFHKTTFGFEALVRTILYLMREQGLIYKDGEEIEKLITDDSKFLNFHDGYVDSAIRKQAESNDDSPLSELCRLLRSRTPPKLIHQVAVLREGAQGQHPEYALFRKDKIEKVKKLAEKHSIPEEFWIWEELPKDVSFEALGPFISLSQVKDLRPDETAELIRIQQGDGSIKKLVDDQHSIIHHLSKLRLQMSRLYLAKPVGCKKFEEIKEEVIAWAEPPAE